MDSREELEKRLLVALDTSEEESKFRLKVMEVLGSLVLCIHWLRGTWNWAYHTGAIRFKDGEEERNFKRLFNDVEVYEKFIWEIAPPRAMVLALRNFRLNGELPEKWESLINQDDAGRIPSDITETECHDIEDVLRRLGGTRIKQAKTMQDLIDLANNSNIKSILG